MLIIYESKHGYTMQLAEKIYGFEKRRNKIFKIPILDDALIEGEEKICILFPVYYGAPIGNVTKFLKRNGNLLKNRKVILGVVGCNPDIFNGISFFLKLRNSDKHSIREKFFGKLEKDYFDKFDVLLIRGIVKKDELSEFEKRYSPNYNNVVFENEFEYDKLYEQLDAI